MLSPRGTADPHSPGGVFRVRTARLAELINNGQNSILTKIKGDRLSIGTKIVNLFCSEDASPAAAAADQGGGAAADEQDQPLRGSGGVEEAPSTPPPKGRGGSLEVPLPQSALDTRPSLRRSKAKSLDSYDLSMLASVDTGNIPCIVDPRIWWRHPMLRLVAVWSILFLDFFIYGVDPAQDSHVTYPFFGVFEDFFIIAWPQRVEHQISRIVLFIVLTMFSFWFGRMVVHHKFLRDFCGLQMFSENNGTLLVNFIVYVIFFEGVLPLPVNYIESGSTAEPVTEHSVLRYMDWGKIWQTMAAVADTLAIVTITDAVMQDRTVWPDFAPRVKWLWNDAAGGWVRVLMAWTGFVIMMPLIVFGLWCDDRTNGIYTMDHVDVLRTTQWMRVAVAAFLTCVDITTCLQDWEFPSFNAPLDFKIVGSFATTIDIQCLTDLTRPISKVITCIPEDFWEVFHFRMSGKWLAYMPAFGSLGVDLYYMIRTIYSFKPIAFGEYVKDCRLFVIVNETFLDSLYLNGAVPANESDYPSWENRQGEGDVVLNSRFCGSHDALSAMFLGFGLFAGIAFIALIIRAEYYWDNYFTRNQEGLHDRINTYYEEAAEKQRQGSEGELGAQE